MRDESRFGQVTEEFWAVDYQRWEKGLNITLRTPVIRLNDGLLLYSPCPIDQQIAEQIDELGEVRHIFAPNRNHHMFLEEAAARWPGARVWGVPGLAAKKRGVKFAGELEGGRPFGDEIELLLSRGAPFSNEVVMHHEPSGTFVCADFVANTNDADGMLTRTLLRALGTWKKCDQNRFWKLCTRDREAARKSAEHILSWGAERLVMAHGDIMETGGQYALENATRWLGPASK